MTKQEFESKMLQAKIMRDLGDRAYYYEGYMRGLRRAYQGRKFGTSKEHEKWLALILDPDETRREKGRGYQDGLQEKSPATT